MNGIKYVHTNIIAKDWRKLTDFYIKVFGCRPTYPERDLSGEWLEKLTKIKDAKVKGMHVTLPGYENGPTLEIFGYDPGDPAAALPRINGQGFGHIAFLVDNVEEVLEKVLANGGQTYGEVVRHDYPELGLLTVTYARDPEGNFLEIQNWKRESNLVSEKPDRVEANTEFDRFETERLIIRRFRAEDWADLHEYLSKEEVVRFEPYGTFDEEASRQEAANRAGNKAFWAVCMKETGKLIGNVYFEKQEPDYINIWEIGYVFNPSYYGKGFATESCRKIMDHAFREQDAHRIIAMCNPKNNASWELLERLGMRREGYFRENIYFKTDENGNPLWCDTYEYAILADEWKTRNVGLGK